MRGVNQVKRLAWRVSGRSRHAAAALMYHRVAEVGHDPWMLAVSPRHFDEHLQVLRAWYQPASAAGLGTAMADGASPTGTVVVTFDDGYVDNLEVAKPLLERHEVPATFFVPTGMLGMRGELWWDELERLLLEPGSLPPVLQCPTLGRAWALDGVADYPPELADSHRTWRSGRPAPTRRHQVYEELWQLLFEQPASTKGAALQELRAAAAAPSEARPSYRTLTADELLALADGHLTEIGSHTVSHPVLSHLPPPEQRREIEASKAALEELLGREVPSLSYPHGRHDASTPRLVAEAGYRSAFTTAFGLVTRRSDPFRLPRLVAPDVDGDGFARWLGRIVPPKARRRAQRAEPGGAPASG